jgi:ATP-binding cassette subfamily B protein
MAGHDDEALGAAYDARLARRLLHYVRPYVPLAAAAVLLLCAAGTLQLVGPALTRWVVDVALPAHDLAGVRRAALLFVGALVAEFVCGYGETVLTALLGQRVMRDLRDALFAHLQRLPVTFFDRAPVGRLVTRVTSDVEALNELFTSGVVAGLGDLFTLLAIAVMMFVVDWRLALVSFAAIPGVLIASRLFQRSVRTAYRDIRTRLARINAFLQERLTGMRVVQVFGREGGERGRFDALNHSHLDAHLKSITAYALYYPAVEILTTVTLAMLVVAAANRVQAGLLSVGTVAAFLQLVRRFFQPLQDLSEKYNILQAAMAASERGAWSGEAVTVSFEDVWFHYGAPSDAPDWVLKGVSFTAPPNETVAIVGHTGAGKSTIVNLLMRFYEPQRGRIAVAFGDAAPVDVRDLPVDTLRSLVGYVQQDIFLFAGDVASNVRLSSAIDDDAVRAALASVGADRVVARLPGELTYALGERGASLSVGERQLLAFARAIAADPALLLLDEATSAVDSESEALIQRALATLMRGRTTIAIAHRLTTIVGADQILVLHHGQIVERGAHAALLARRGLYERLYRLQVGETNVVGAPAA